MTLITKEELDKGLINYMASLTPVELEQRNGNTRTDFMAGAKFAEENLKLLYEDFLGWINEQDTFIHMDGDLWELETLEMEFSTTELLKLYYKKVANE